MADQTDADGIPAAADVQAVIDKTDLAGITDIESEDAEKILHICDVREGNKKSGENDVLVQLEDWAWQEWSDYEITGSPFVLCGYIQDYSEKAYKVTGAFEVQMDAIEGRSYDEVTDDYVTNLIQQIDETDEDFHDERGEAFLPKSAVANVMAVEE